MNKKGFSDGIFLLVPLVTLCFMCLMGLYAAINEDARKRTVKQTQGVSPAKAEAASTTLALPPTLPLGYTIQTNGKKFRWHFPSGAASCFQYDSKEACVEACQNFYQYTLENANATWTGVKP